MSAARTADDLLRDARDWEQSSLDGCLRDRERLLEDTAANERAIERISALIADIDARLEDAA